MTIGREKEIQQLREQTTTIIHSQNATHEIAHNAHADNFQNEVTADALFG